MAASLTSAATRPLLKIAAGVAGALILAVLVGGFLTNPFHWKEKLAQHWRGKAEAAQAQATLNGAEAVVGRETLAAFAAATRADARTHDIQSENRDAIFAAPGAEAPLDPGLAGAFIDGLCRYDAYHDDPGCHRLLEVPRAPEGADAGRDPADGR